MLIRKEDKHFPLKRNPKWIQVRRMGEFQCDCGGRIVVEINSVTGKRGNTRSCGCLGVEARLRANTTHGRSKRKSEHYPTYSSWQHMKDRCLNKNNKYYHNYGGRGIGVCKRWKESFENFLEDMGDRELWQSIERIDNDRNYEPSNCRWASFKEQMNNTRRTKI